MTLHVFNPEHDLALAAGTPLFTPPMAATKLRQAWGYLPALWADEGDCVLVDALPQPICCEEEHVDVCQYAMRRAMSHHISFITPEQLRQHGMPPSSRQHPADGNRGDGCITAISPWGWDAALKRRLTRLGVDNALMPTDQALEAMRLLSHRRNAAQTPAELRSPLTVGEAWECFDEEEAAQHIGHMGRAVLKAPWSSSGRGVRFVGGQLTPSELGWMKNVLNHQGSIIVEPYYNKLMDFAMEFCSDGKGTVRYLGLSVFSTSGVAYSGGIIASEQAKESMVCNYLTKELLYHTRALLQQKLGAMCRDIYKGMLGVDMMVVKKSSCNSLTPYAKALLHPCVEINLRHTMGHVALALAPMAYGDVMAINSDNNYQLKIHRL